MATDAFWVKLGCPINTVLTQTAPNASQINTPACNKGSWGVEEGGGGSFSRGVGFFSMSQICLAQRLPLCMTPLLITTPPRTKDLAIGASRVGWMGFNEWPEGSISLYPFTVAVADRFQRHTLGSCLICLGVARNWPNWAMATAHCQQVLARCLVLNTRLRTQGFFFVAH